MNGNIQASNNHTQIQERILMTTAYKNICNLIKAINLKYIEYQNKIKRENDSFLIKKNDFNVSYESEKIDFTYRFILEKHNLKILEYSIYIDDLKALEERLKYQLLFISSKMNNDDVNVRKSRNKFVEIIQEQSLKKIENEIQLIRQKKITYSGCNKYIDYLKDNDYEKEYDEYYDLYCSSDVFESLDNKRYDLEFTKSKYIQLFKNLNYDFDDSIFFDKELLSLDVFKLLENLYPDYNNYVQIDENKKNM